MENRFEELKAENKYLREQISNIVAELDDARTRLLWNNLNELIENEIKQEDFCNK